MQALGSRGFVLGGILALAILIALALVQTALPSPVLDPSPEPPTRLDQPSSGRLLREDEVRAQLGAEWRDARITERRWADLAPLPLPAGNVHAERLMWLVVRERDAAKPGWEIRVYDAASGIRLLTFEGEGPPPL